MASPLLDTWFQAGELEVVNDAEASLVIPTRAMFSRPGKKNCKCPAKIDQ
jgi:hypothetical protein